MGPEHVAGHDADLPAALRRGEDVVVEPLTVVLPEDGMPLGRARESVATELGGDDGGDRRDGRIGHDDIEVHDGLGREVGHRGRTHAIDAADVPVRVG